MKFVAHGGPCTCLSIGQKSGHVLVTGGDDKKVNLWAIGKPNVIMSLTGHTTSIECVKFSHNEDLVCAGSVSGALKVWDLEAAKLLRTLTGHRLATKSLDFHPYGDFLASGSADTNIKLWDIRKKGCMYTYKGHSKDVHCLKFSPDGRWLASGGDEGSVKLWDLPAGKLLIELKEHTAPVTDVCFHPNEFLLSSASIDGTVKFWDLETFQQVSTTVNDAGPVRKILYHSEGKALLSAARDILKVYGWEPARTFDTLVMGWGKVNDIAISDNQLVAGTFSLTNVSVFVIDLKKVQPFGHSPLSSKQLFCRDSFKRQSTRKNFIHNHCSTTHSQLESLESNRSDETETGSDEPGDESLMNELNQVDDFKDIFVPSRQLNRTPPHSDSISYAHPPFPSMDQPHKASEHNLSSLFTPYSSFSNDNRQHNNINTVEPISKLLSSHLTVPVSSSSSKLSSGYTVSNNSTQVQASSLRSNTKSMLTLPVVSQSPTSQPSVIKQSVSTTTVNVAPTDNHNGYIAKISTSVSSSALVNSNQKTIKSTNLVHPRQSEMISVVRPVMSDRKSNYPANGQATNGNNNNNIINNNDDKNSVNNNSISSSSISNDKVKASSVNNNHSVNFNTVTTKPSAAATVFSELKSSKEKTLSNPESPVEVIPEARDHPTGLDLDDFLPKHLQDTIRLGYHPQPEMSESEAMQSILRGHKSVVTALSHRRKNLQIVLAMWNTKDPRSALEHSVNIEDHSVIVDILNVITLKPAIWTLDMCQILIQPIYELLQSRYESYMLAGCSALKLILKNFANIIKSNITAHPGIGVDISREERYHKCMGCYNHLLNVRAFILKRQTLQGKLGRTFRELSILMQSLE